MFTVNSKTLPASGWLHATHWTTKRALSGAAANTPENLRRWIQDPNVIKPGSKMPAMGLSDPELNAVTSYLETLH